jgi:MFS transporter, DHA1 family, multidrug resistance protein
LITDMQHAHAAKPEAGGPGQVEFVFLISSVMMLVAFAIDSMLPALPFIGASLAVVVENDRQFVITAFMIGFGVAQFFVGTISDRYGRRGLMLWSLLAYAVTSLGAALAPSFELLLVARAAQGMAAAGARVLVTSIVRDRFEGRAMAQVMSLAHVIFMAAPILAPLMGQAVIAIGPWRWIFGILCILGSLAWLWVAIRLPETLDPANQHDISKAQIWSSWNIVLRDRQSVGYTIAITAMTIGLMGFLVSVQQIFFDVFHRADFLPTGFGIMAAGMAVASLTNATIVMRYGMRHIGHWAIIFFTLFAGLHALVAFLGYETLWSFIVLQTLMMLGFSFAVGNLGAMAMENMGVVAGTASSLQGSFSTLTGAAAGAIIGQSFDGTTLPLYLSVFVCGCLALVSVFVTEGGRLFVARHAPTIAGD